VGGQPEKKRFGTRAAVYQSARRFFRRRSALRSASAQRSGTEYFRFCDARLALYLDGTQRSFRMESHEQRRGFDGCLRRNFRRPQNPLAYRTEKITATPSNGRRNSRQKQGEIRRRNDSLFAKLITVRFVALRAGKSLAVRAASVEVSGRLFEQKWAMARARTLNEFKAAMAQRRLTGSNTMYADRRGNIFYLHGNATPRRSTKFDWSKPVDGSDAETDWRGFHELSELPQVLESFFGLDSKLQLDAVSHFKHRQSRPLEISGLYGARPGHAARADVAAHSFVKENSPLKNGRVLRSTLM
jgi:hypothetical protein